VVVAALAGFASPLSALAIDTGTLGIRPSTESDFFHLAVLPGEQLDAVAIVTNRTAEPMALLTYAVDGQSTPEGAFALEGQDDTRNEIGAWAELDDSEIVVPPESELEVPFRISIPIGTQTGDYAGGLVIQSAPLLGETTDESGTPTRIDVVQRQGVRIYLTVPGDAMKALDAGDLAWTTSDGDVTITLPVTNMGNTTLYPTASVTVDRWFTEQTTLDFAAPESVLPGATVVLHATLAKVDAVQIGSARASVTSAAGIDTATTTFFHVPWLILTGLVVLLVALAYGMWRAGRFIRRARRALAQVARRDVATAPPVYDVVFEVLPIGARDASRHANTSFREPLG
jgi:hypothetical protein